MNALPATNVKPFIIYQDGAIASRWIRWKRNLELYFATNNITEDSQMRNSLLYLGGDDIQDTYDSLPGATCNNIGLKYVTAIKKLDEYFMPKQTMVYERHLFREMVLKPGERIEAFILRLRDQSTRCDNQKDQMIIDQVVEKCDSSELRKKLLEKDHSLSKVIEISKSLESIKRQIQAFNQPKRSENSEEIHHSVNKVDENRKHPRTENNFDNYKANMTGKCFRCGKAGHYGNSMECPAKNK